MIPFSSICFFSTMRWGIFQEGRFLGKVLDEWVDDSQEFIHTKLPHLFVIAVIAFILNRLLRLITRRMVRVAEQHAAGPGRLAEVRTLSGVIRATGLADHRPDRRPAVSRRRRLQSCPASGLGRDRRRSHRPGRANHRQRHVQRHPDPLEDQFNVGDTVRLAGLTGTVEAMTLRKTTVRDGDGTLYVIPNSQITTVANLSAGFSVATINVSVDFSADPDEVIKLLKQIAMDVRNSDEFRGFFCRIRRFSAWTR